MSDGRFKLLLLEDNPTDALLLKEAMREASAVTFEIVTAERLSEATRLIQTQHFDLVLADLNLPDSSGIETINQIRHVSRALPVVVLTGMADEQMALAALHEGAQDYLIKGMTGSDALVRAIRYSIERKRSEELELAKEAAERANAAKDLFLAALSHELRTPLSPVMSAVQILLMNPELPPEDAVKFTPSGGSITISCRVLERSVRIEVSDTGIGIEPDALERIFNTFEQQGKTVTRQYGGLGLGLAISKTIIQLHGGTIHAESAGSGKGASFIVELPLATDATVIRKTEEASAPKAAQGAKVLLIEDHCDTVTVMNTVLRNAGFHVTTAYNLQEGRAALTKDDVDLVICDLALPDGSGLEFMEEVAKTRPLVKGIAVSGYGRDEDVERSIRAGFTEHLVKPISIDRLLGALNRSVPESRLPA